MENEAEKINILTDVSLNKTQKFKALLHEILAHEDQIRLTKFMAACSKTRMMSRNGLELITDMIEAGEIPLERIAEPLKDLLKI